MWDVPQFQYILRDSLYLLAHLYIISQNSAGINHAKSIKMTPGYCVNQYSSLVFQNCLNSAYLSMVEVKYRGGFGFVFLSIRLPTYFPPQSF